MAESKSSVDMNVLTIRARLSAIALLVGVLIDTRHERATHDRSKSATLQGRRVTRRFVRSQKQ